MADTASGETSLTLQVVSPTGLVEDTTVSLVALPGVGGDFGVMAGHAPFFTRLRSGVISYDEGGMPRTLAVSSGFVEVTQERVIVLARTCERKDDIDVDRARKAKEAADKDIASLSYEDEGHAKAEADLNRAEARLLAASGENIYG